MNMMNITRDKILENTSKASVHLFQKFAKFVVGEMISLGTSGHVIFIGSPRLSSLNEMMERNLYFSDIPKYDVTRELVLHNQQRMAEIAVR